MGLSQSLYTGWSGMATHQRGLDNLSNNLANSNTVGFKKSDFMFSSVMNKLISGAMQAEGVRGSVNPNALGLGVGTGAILNNFTPGPTESTGNPLDVAIGGNGFFLAGTNSGVALTRNGSLYLDHTESPNRRLLCVGDGLPVQGWMAENGVVTPSNNIGNIYLPAMGDLMPGKTTSEVDLRGILPTNTASADFAGRGSSSLDLKGNLTTDQSLLTHIYVPVSKSGVTPAVSNEVQKVQVEINFTGPTLSPDGTVNEFAWTMKTKDWPSPGDPEVQIYPQPEQTADNKIGFYAEGSVEKKRAAGQATESLLRPGSAKVSVSKEENGNTVTSSFTIPSNFRMDVSRLTNLADAPGGNALETWHVDGNPKGSMARTITVYDEYTDFVAGTDEAGNEIMKPTRRVSAREDTLIFSKVDSDNAGTNWKWESSLGDSTGELRFNTAGDLVSSSQSGGKITYDFGELRNINSEGTIQATAQNGYRDGTLKDISIDQHGKIIGHYTNDITETLAQLALGTVPNLSGLESSSGTLFYPGSASGNLMIGVAGDSENNFGLPPIGAGYISSGRLEASNVDLGQEFTNMINLERGYQMNGKTITTSDEMLQTALNLKR